MTELEQTHAKQRQKSLVELHGLERRALARSLCEAIRLLESERFAQLTDRDIRDVANYRAIELGEETFFELSFTPGKEAASTLALARVLGADVVLEDLYRLRAALGCNGARAAAIGAA